MVWILCIAAALVIILIIRNAYELSHLKAAYYVIESEKIRPEDAMRAVFVSDLHGCSYGEGNKELFDLIRAQNPDAIFIGGDIFNGGFSSKDEVSYAFTCGCSKIAKTYMASGNHEKLIKILCGDDVPEKIGAPGTKKKWDKSFFTERLQRLDALVKECGVTYLENESTQLNGSITLTGLDIEMKYYEKISPPKPNLDVIKGYIGNLDESRFNILLAHSPEFFELYSQTDTDLVLSGHYHGGTIRLPLIGGVMSPRGVVFPKHSYGRFKMNETELIVTSGCGQHHVNVRLGNRPEIVVLDFKNKEK